MASSTIFSVAVGYIVFILTVFALFSTSSAEVTQGPPGWHLLREYVTYAYSAFCLTGLQDWSCFWCTNMTGVPKLTVTFVIESDTIYGTYGYVGYSESQIVVSFRGSVSVENFISDAEFFLIDYPGVQGALVHAGFYEAYTVVSPSVVAAVKAIKQNHPDLPISVTGHSLGAALAVICALDLAQSGFNGDVQVWTFGQPRVGNSVFANYYNMLIPISRRTVNHHDLIPHVPPEFLFYHHTATEIWFPMNYTTFKICNGSGEDPNCSDSVPVYDYIAADHLLYLGYNGVAGQDYGCPGTIM